METPQTEQTARKPSDDLPDGAPDGLKQAADGKPGKDPYDPSGVTEAPPKERSEPERAQIQDAAKKEISALDYLLGTVKPVKFTVKARLDTARGRAELTFHCHQIDGDRIITLEDQYKKGGGPFAELDDVRLNAAIAYEATDRLTDSSGREVDVQGGEFAGEMVDPRIALEKRFQFQPGVLAGVAAQVRQMAGYSGDRVEAAEVAIETAVSNS